MDWYLGIDLGTSSVKCAAVNQAGDLLDISSRPYPAETDQPAWKTQNPEDIYQGMVLAVRDLLDQGDLQAGDCRGASIGCALHGLLALDGAEQPLTPVYTWADDRADPQAADVKGTAEELELYRITGCPAHGMYPLYKILWLRENRPEVLLGAERLVSVKEYLFARLTGEYLVDPSLASGSGLLDIHRLAWHPGALDRAGITDDLLSPLADPRQSRPLKDGGFRNRTGFSPGLPLILGSSDAVNSTLGAGAVLPGQATCMIGSSGAYRMISPQPRLSPGPSTWCYGLDQDHWLVGGALNNGGLALSWLKESLRVPGWDTGELGFDELVGLAEQAEPGCRGLFCLPLFAGERSPGWNLQARGVFFGLGIDHDLRHLARAVLEGIAYRLRTLDDALEGLTGEIREVRASGGFTRSPFWSQLTSDVLGRPLDLPADGDTSARGSAFWALLADRPSLTLADFGNMVEVTTAFHPRPELSALYQRGYRLHRELSEAADPLFTSLAAFRRDLSA